MEKLITVADYIYKLQEFPEDWNVQVSTSAGGGISIEHREVGGKSIVAIFGSNGGRFGENPMTENEYQLRSKEFINMINNSYRYTSIHGDHRLYFPGGINDTCYGTHFDRRIIERMVDGGLIPNEMVDIEKVRYLGN